MNADTHTGRKEKVETHVAVAMESETGPVSCSRCSEAGPLESTLPAAIPTLASGWHCSLFNNGH